MRPFYIIKNKHGFYSVSFVNQKTGERTSYKSTHTSDYSQAMMTATLWLRDGIPETQARRVSKTSANDSGLDIQKLITRLSDTEAKTLYEMITK